MIARAAFARTLRSLDADGWRITIFTLLLAAILLAAWTWWFFTPSIISTVPELVTLNWDPTGSHVAIRNPSPELFAQLRKDQPVRLLASDRIISARIASWSLWKLPFDSSLVLLDLPSTPQPPLPTRAKIEIASSPASVVLGTLHE
jgi:hypothetical protein